MQALEVHQGKVLALDRKNVDTDQIIPKQYLLRVVRDGFGETLFDDWRYLDPGEADGDHSRRRPNPDFVLNQPRYAGSSVLLARDNFGCGSSREHAVWALMQYGFRVIVAESYSDIFADNAFKNGLLLVGLARAQIDQLFALDSIAGGALELKVDLRNTRIERVNIPDGEESFSCAFAVSKAHRKTLLAGLDDIGSSLDYIGEIKNFERRYLRERPWLARERSSR